MLVHASREYSTMTKLSSNTTGDSKQWCNLVQAVWPHGTIYAGDIECIGRRKPWSMKTFELVSNIVEQDQESFCYEFKSQKSSFILFEDIVKLGICQSFWISLFRYLKERIHQKAKSPYVVCVCVCVPLRLWAPQPPHRSSPNLVSRCYTSHARKWQCHTLGRRPFWGRNRGPTFHWLHAVTS